jgi:branched-chain amino acid transport system substrate-binding protein
MFRRNLYAAAVSAVGVAVLSACAAPQPGGSTGTANGEPIPIGAALAQTSNVSLLGQEEILGVQLAEKYFNDNGGVDGRKIKVVVQDTAGDEGGAINAFQSLINSGKVVAIVGPTLSQQAFAADPLAEKAGVPVIAPSNTAKGIPEIGKFISRVSAPVTVVAPNSVAQALAQDPSIKDVVVAFAQNDAFSQSETQVFQGVVKEKGLNLKSVQTFQTTDTDFTAQATNILNAKPQLVIVSGLAADGGNLVKQLRELGYTGLIIGGNGLNTANIFPVCGRKCDGVLIAQAYSPQESNAINTAFRDAYRSKQGKEPPQFSAQAFAGIQVVVEGLRAVAKAGKISDLDLATLRLKLNDAILAGTYVTPLGNIAFTADGEIKQDKFYVAQIVMTDDKNGSFKFVR